MGKYEMLKKQDEEIYEQIKKEEQLEQYNRIWEYY